MKRGVTHTLLLSVAFAGATVAMGWVAVPAVAIVWGLVRPKAERPALVAMLAAGLGWAWLLGWNAAVGEVSELIRRTAGVFAVPGVGFVALSLAFPMVMAWGAAAVAAAVRWSGAPAATGAASSESGGWAAEASGPRRSMLKGEIEVGRRTWLVREEIRQGPRPQIFILTAADQQTSEMHIRPLAGVTLTTMAEVQSNCGDPLSRTFADAGGIRWEARMVVSSGEPGEIPQIKIYSYRSAEVFEVPYRFADGLGIRTDAELLALLETGKASSAEQ